MKPATLRRFRSRSTAARRSRSEERRVGKDCRPWPFGYQFNKFFSRRLINQESVMAVVHYEHIVFPLFFSSRRRHTSFDCDWSSDVCSSDLVNAGGPNASIVALNKENGAVIWKSQSDEAGYSSAIPLQVNGGTQVKIGRASCRERL